jgi:predicted dehydrogenase
MLTVGVAGVAHIHIPGFLTKMKERPDVKVKYVWDPQKERAQKRAAEIGAKAVASARKIWKDPEIQAVVVCSETNLHKKLVLKGAAARKHLFVEKPLGLGAKDGCAMAQAIEQAGVIFQTGYGMRSSAINLFLKEQIKLGNFGAITRARGSNCHAGSLKGLFDTEWRWMADPKVAGCGAFGDLGTHSLDLLMWLLGDVEKVAARTVVVTRRYGDCDEYGEGLLVFKSGVTATLAAGWVDVANPVSLLISGTEGHAVVFRGELYFTSAKVPGADGKTPWTQLPPALPHPLDLFLDAASGKPDLPLVSAREAAARSSVMEALYTAARKGKWVAVS